MRKNHNIKVKFDPDPIKYLQNVIEEWNHLSFPRDLRKDRIDFVSRRLVILHLQEIAESILLNNLWIVPEVFKNNYKETLDDFIGIESTIEIDRETQENSGIKPIRFENNVEYLFKTQI